MVKANKCLFSNTSIKYAYPVYCQLKTGNVGNHLATLIKSMKFLRYFIESLSGHGKLFFGKLDPKPK